MGNAGTGTAQARAVRAYRQRLRKQGLVRFEVVGRPQDREMVRSFARRLANLAEPTDATESVPPRVALDPRRKRGVKLERAMEPPLFTFDHPMFRLIGIGRSGGGKPGAREKHELLAQRRRD